MKSFKLETCGLQVQPFRTVRKSQSAAEDRHSSLKEVARYDIRHMRAAFSGSLPIVNDIDPTQPVSTKSSIYSICSCTVATQRLPEMQLSLLHPAYIITEARAS